MHGFVYSNFWYREVFEEKITPIVLDIEEEAKDEDHVHEADEDDHHHPRVDRHPQLPLRPLHWHESVACLLPSEWVG